MKKQSFIAALLLSLSIQANAVVISLEGQEADGANLNIFGLTNSDTSEVLEIGYNFIYQALEPSWGSEMVLEVGHIDSDTFFQFGTQEIGCADFGVVCEVDLAFSDEPGVYTASGTLSLTAGEIADGSGLWEILIADSFDDDGADGVFLAGSFIEVVQGTRSVSSPAAVLLLLLSLGVLTVRKQLFK